MNIVDLLSSLRSYLLADAQMASLIGNRITNEPAEQHSVTPYVVVLTVSGGALYAHDGPTGNQEVRLQFDIYDESMSVCLQVRDRLVTLLSGLSGEVGTVHVGFCFLDNEVDFYHTNTGLKRRVVDFRVMAQ